MIKTQIVKEKNKPVAVIMDYKEYVRLREIEQERKDYHSAAKTKAANKKSGVTIATAMVESPRHKENQNTAAEPASSECQRLFVKM